MSNKKNKINPIVQQYIKKIEEDCKNKSEEEVIEENKKLIKILGITELSSYFIMKFKEKIDKETYNELELNVINGPLELAVELSTKIRINNIYQLEQRILDSKDPKQICLFLINNNTPYKKQIEEKLLQTNSTEFNCKYAQYLLKNRKNIKQYEQIVLQSNEPKWICELGISLLEIGYNDNIENYIDRIIECKDAQYVYIILKEVSEKAPSIDISKYKEKIIKLGVSKLIYRMASLLNNKKNDDLENAIIKSNDIVMVYIYAKNIQNIDINIFTRKIIQSGNYELMIKYAKEVLNKRNENINDIQDAIIKTNNTEIITEFATTVNGINALKCFEPIYNSKNIEIICEFVKKLPELDEKILSVMVENKKEASWSCNFIKYFPETDFEIHRQIILDSKDPKWNYEFIKYIQENPRYNIELLTLEHEKIIKESNNEKYTYLFSQLKYTTIVIEQPDKTKRHTIEKYQKPINNETTLEDLEEIWSKHNIDWIIMFVKMFPEAKQEISRRIIEVNNPKWSYYFMKTTGNIDWEEHKEIVLSNPIWKEKYKKLFGKAKSIKK